MAESVLRVEMTKTEQFNVIDKLDMIEILKKMKLMCQLWEKMPFGVGKIGSG